MNLDRKIKMNRKNVDIEIYIMREALSEKGTPYMAICQLLTLMETFLQYIEEKWTNKSEKSKEQSKKIQPKKKKNLKISKAKTKSATRSATTARR